MDLLFGYYVSMIGYFVSISSPNRFFSWGEDVDITAKSGLFSQMRVFCVHPLAWPLLFHCFFLSIVLFFSGGISIIYVLILFSLFQGVSVFISALVFSEFWRVIYVRVISVMHV